MLIVPGACTVTSKYIVTIISQEALNSLCQIMYPSNCTNYNTYIQKYLNMHHTNGNAQTTEQKNNGPKSKVHHVS